MIFRVSGPRRSKCTTLSSTSNESDVESLEEEEAGNVNRKAEDTEAEVAIQGEVPHASSHDE